VKEEPYEDGDNRKFFYCREPDFAIKREFLTCFNTQYNISSRTVLEHFYIIYISWYNALIKKKVKFYLYIMKIRRDRLQSHIWLTASSYMDKYLRISSYIRSPSSCITLKPIPSEFPNIWGKFSFFYQCVWDTTVRGVLESLLGFVLASTAKKNLYFPGSSTQESLW
jgi:hypothetical protein